MQRWITSRLVAISFILVAVTASIGGQVARDPKTWSSVVPRTWDDQEMESLELPLAQPAASPRHISSDYYYQMPVRPIYKSYPVYRPDRQPAGYADFLEAQQPEIIFDSSRLRTEEDWIKAGELVFDAPIEFESSGSLFSEIKHTGWFDKNRILTTKDGILPNMKYVIREKGKIELGILSCAMCHSRVMPDGSVIKGAQGNFPDDRAFGYETRMEAANAKDAKVNDKKLQELRSFMRKSYAAPWLQNDPNSQPERMTLEQIVSVMEAIPPGACARQGTSAFYPARIPDLIGIKDRRYLDASGLVRHRAIGDLMRYAALNQGADLLSAYADFRPRGDLPDPSKESRYSDEQLYALALFLYSLKPPPNPNKFDNLASRGKQVFEEQGCGLCHTPPLYTNNKLTPADGFQVTDEQRKRDDIMSASVHTDSTSTLKTRRGTGYYKVPSLRGLWYRGPFEHNGSVATLEDWFDPGRLRDDYTPTGFRGYGVKARAVKGHQFGLDLSTQDRRALIAFLKTL